MKRSSKKLYIKTVIILCIFLLPYYFLKSIIVDADVSYDVTIPHVIINQIYGAGDGGYVTHSFIELYNTTENDINLDGWSLQYRSANSDVDNSNEWNVFCFEREDSIPAKSSFLIRCNPDAKGEKNEYRIDLYENGTYDASWNQEINTKGCAVVLRTTVDRIDSQSTVFNQRISKPEIGGYVDMLAVAGNDKIEVQRPAWYEKSVKDVQSKRYGIRRIHFADTDDNSIDAEVVDYKTSTVDSIRPRCANDGAWGAFDENNFIVEILGTDKM